MTDEKVTAFNKELSALQDKYGLTVRHVPKSGFFVVPTEGFGKAVITKEDITPSSGAPSPYRVLIVG